MFDLSFTEFMIIGVVALLVIGPERLPKVARTIGHLVGRAQRYVNDVKTDMRREMDSSEISDLKSQVKEAASSVRSSVDNVGNTIRNPMEEAKKALKETEQTLKNTEESLESSIRGEAKKPQETQEPTHHQENQALSSDPNASPSGNTTPGANHSTPTDNTKKNGTST